MVTQRWQMAEVTKVTTNRNSSVSTSVIGYRYSNRVPTSHTPLSPTRSTLRNQMVEHPRARRTHEAVVESTHTAPAIYLTPLPLARLERRPTRLLGAALAEGRKVSSTAVSASAAVSWSMGAACERRRERTVGVVVGVRRGGEEGGGDLGIGGLRGSERGDLPPCSRGRNASPGERGRWK